MCHTSEAHYWKRQWLVAANTDVVMLQAYKTYNDYRFIDTSGLTVVLF